MQRVKNQHYVPRSYLERFCSSGGKVFVFDKASKAVFQTGVRNVASENGFYDLPPFAAAERQAVEKALSKVEADAKAAIDDLLAEVESNGRFDPNRENRQSVLATYIALQDVRTLAFRRSYDQIMDQLTAELTRHHEFARKHYEAKGERVETQDVNVSIQPDRLAVEHAKLMFSPEYLARAMAVLRSHIWLVGRNQTVQPLYTSDSPVARHGHNPHWFFGGMGLESSGVEICLPLTPNFVLIIVERTFFEGHLPLRDGDAFDLTPEYVEFYNYLQVAQSRRHIYCSEDRFDYVRAIADKSPDLLDTDRGKFRLVNGPG